MLFKKGSLTVRKLESRDAAILAKWLSDPTVLEYYEGRDNPHDTEKVLKNYFDHEDEVHGCIVENEGVQIGYIQFYPLDAETKEIYGYTDDESEILYGMDQFIGEVEYWNQGIGQLLVQAMVEFLVKNKDADRVVMDPQTWNKRAIRCYENSGFEKVKLLPKHELHEGEFRDCWLIEYRK